MNSTRHERNVSLVKDSLTCPLCGNVEITTTNQPHSFNYGTGEMKVQLTVDAHVRRCSSCDFEYLDHVTENLKQEAICQYLGVLSPKEIRRIREKCGMSRPKFAHVTGLGEASLNRWENGLNIQSLAYDRYLRLLAIPDTMRTLKQVVNDIIGPATRVTVENRFRFVDEADDRLLQEKNIFKLRPAA